MFWLVLCCTVLFVGDRQPCAQTGEELSFADGAYTPEDGGAPILAEWTYTNADVRAVFQGLSEIAKVDIVLSDNVQGKVSLQVTNKSWKDVFNIVARLRGLVALKGDGYIYVVTRDEFNQKQMKEAENTQAVEQLAPLVREVIRVNNLSASEMQGSISTLLSQRGKITVAQHSNSLIVYDTEDNISQVRDMVTKLDVETQQVSISAKIIEVNTSALQNMGVQWGLFGNVAGSQASAQHLPGEVVANAIERLSYGILSQDRLAVTLEYLFQESQGEVVAQPSITTLDNKQARIFMGGKIPLLYNDEAGNTLVKYENAGTDLTVTPHVTDLHRIMLTLNAKKESPGEGGSINSQTAQTSVVVNDGETVVIAGLTTNELQEGEDGIPVLKDIPLLGHLFKRSRKTVSKKDLLIFVTPHIIQKDLEAVRVGNETPEPGIAETVGE